MQQPRSGRFPSRATSPANGSPRRDLLPRRGLSLVTILVSLLVVALATIAIGSTIVAKRASEARDRAKKDFAESSAGFNALVAAVATNVKPPRKELLQPALDYYQKFVQSHAADKDMHSELATARFHLAALHTKLGSKEGVNELTAGLGDLFEMSQDENADPATFPSLQDSALKVTTPFEWFSVKDVDQAYGMKMVVAINRANDLYSTLAKKHPENIAFRDNQSALFRGAAFLQNQLLNQREKSLESWTTARDILETLVRDQPANKDYQVRLAEALVNVARAQQTAKDNEKAITNWKRAVEVREQLAAANPDDKQIKQDLTTAKRTLERLTAAPAQGTGNKETTASKEAPEKQISAADKDPAVAENKEPPAETPPPDTEKKDAPPAEGDTPAADKEPASVAEKDPPPAAP